jgi:AAA+ superfamily predicted ATPase
MPGPRPLETLADVLLQRQALIARLELGIVPHDFAGLYVDEGEVERILAQLPGISTSGSDDATVAIATSQDVLEARRAFVASLVGDDEFANVVRNACLSIEEAEVVALVAAVEISAARQRLIAYLQDDVTLPRPTLATLDAVFAPPHIGAAAAGPAASAVAAGLLDVAPEGPWARRMVSLSGRFAWALAGDGSPDPALPPGTRWVTTPGGDIGADLVVVSGADGASRLQAACRACRPGSYLVAPAPESGTGWKALVREATVSGSGIVLELVEALTAEGRDCIEASDHVPWIVSSPNELDLAQLPRRPWLELRVDDGVATDDEWRSLLGVPSSGHRLTRLQLEQVGRALPSSRDLSDAVRRLAGGHLDGLAVRVRPRRGWNDLVLPADDKQQLRELAARYRDRPIVYEEWGFRAIPSAGLVALFAGQSGTGKTLAAEIVAGDLGLDMYRVDLSAVVSKWVGETEKNLERIFDAAAAGRVVLFFDEADALFGKRSEVSDAHDRYANIEVAYLLQRIENYDGLVVLATNLQKNMDQAFLRRIHVAVDFPMPDVVDRRRIWELSFPDSAPLGDLDLDFLARQFKVSGGSIRNAVVNAAFFAADGDAVITMEMVMLGLKREFQKLGRLRTETEFDRYFDLVKGEADAVVPG